MAVFFKSRLSPQPVSGRGSRSRSQSGEDAAAALELELAVSFRARFENFCPLLSPREFLFVD